ncbi:hypothetical protein EAO66_27665 [Klebsiella pneumoniae]|nr:hypothetical protein EAO66_27665 [Klebsiella pneumoniae]
MYRFKMTDVVTIFRGCCGVALGSRDHSDRAQQLLNRFQRVWLGLAATVLSSGVAEITEEHP